LPPSIPPRDLLAKENRYAKLLKAGTVTTRTLLEEAEHDVRTRWQMYEKLASNWANTKPSQKK